MKRSLTRLFCLCLLNSLCLVAGGAEPLRVVLTSAEQGVHLEQWRISNHDLHINSPQDWSVEKRTLHGGKQEGVDLIEVDNGAMQLAVVPTRGMGLLWARAGDVRLGWDSPVKEAVHPKFINLHDRGGLGWLEGFNEWVVRCGLEFAGHPGTDRFINNVGDEAEMELTLHGKVANIPASEVEVLIDREPPYRIRVRGKVEERMFYGPKLELWTELSTEPGSMRLRLEDHLTNRGAFDQEFEIIYHSNYGPPLLEKGSRFVGAARRITPFNAHAAEGLNHYGEYAGPTKGFIEQVYCIYPYGDAQNRTTVLLENAAGDRAVSMTFSLDELPVFTVWKNTTAPEEGYVTGLEPGTNFSYNRRLEREAGRVQKLKPGETRRFAIEYAVHSGRDDVSAAVDRIKALQGNRPPKVDRAPVTVE